MRHANSALLAIITLVSPGFLDLPRPILMRPLPPPRAMAGKLFKKEGLPAPPFRTDVSDSFAFPPDIRHKEQDHDQ